MWQPDPAWQPLPGGLGASTAGVWRAETGGRAVVVKRLVPPAGPSYDGSWRRAADVALHGVVDATAGLRSPVTAVEEDPGGVTLISDWVEPVAVPGLFAAACLGRFADVELGTARWLARDQLRDRLARVEHRGGWRTLARTPVADVADHLWRHRGERLAVLDGLPQVAQHGDPVPSNLRGRAGDTLLAIDWGTLGRGPVGGDLGYLALSAREDFEALLDAYVGALPPDAASHDQAALGARVTAVYTALSRAEWALARVAPGEGALAGKFTHPSVAPHLRALQRLFPQLEQVL